MYLIKTDQNTFHSFHLHSLLINVHHEMIATNQNRWILKTLRWIYLTWHTVHCPFTRHVSIKGKKQTFYIFFKFTDNWTADNHIFKVALWYFWKLYFLNVAVHWNQACLMFYLHNIVIFFISGLSLYLLLCFLLVLVAYFMMVIYDKKHHLSLSFLIPAFEQLITCPQHGSSISDW